MRSIRLLPIVVFASLALLAFKTIGLVTHGSYALTGTVEAAAAGGGASKPAAEHGAPAADETAEPITIPPEPTLEDAAPTLEDAAPTLKLAPEAAAGGGHGAEAAQEGEAAPAAEGGHGAAAPEGTAGPAGEPAGDGAAGNAPVVPELTAEAAASPDATHGAEPAAANADATAEAGAEVVQGVEPANETERTILNRLAQRRSELDAIDGELAMRKQLVEAAEQKLAERTAALEAIEARINGLVDQAKVVDEAQFKSLVSMYENMKPAEAAAIFDSLDIEVLYRVAKAINPRKMAPIMAKMTPAVAQVLTVRMAATSPVTQPATINSADLSSELPQIVGQ